LQDASNFLLYSLEPIEPTISWPESHVLPYLQVGNFQLETSVLQPKVPVAV